MGTKLDPKQSMLTDSLSASNLLFGTQTSEEKLAEQKKYKDSNILENKIS